MLQTAKPKFEKEVEKILKKSMYEAFKSTFSMGDEDVVNKHMENAIKESAKKFSESVAKEATIPLTDAIDEYIKASGLFINVTPAGIALTSPTGPVTGTITITPQTSNIIIK